MGIVLALSLPGNAYAQGSWEQRDGSWYYLREDGARATGWVEADGKSYYLYEDGRCAMDTITPDGYYVDAGGAWYRKSTSVLEEEDILFAAPDRFIPPVQGQEGWPGMDSLILLREAVVKAFGQERTISITDTAIEYRTVKDKKVLLGLYKDMDKMSYRLDMSIKLDKESSDRKQGETYDYAVFKALLYQFSSSPDVLEQAIYSGWQGKNLWQINRMSRIIAGDCGILYASGAGYGRFWIDARTGE